MTVQDQMLDQLYGSIIQNTHKLVKTHMKDFSNADKQTVATLTAAALIGNSLQTLAMVIHQSNLPPEANQQEQGETP